MVKAARSERPKGHGDALASLIGFAFRHMPARGIFEPGDIDDAVFWKEIQDVARAHLGFDGARAEMRKALDKAELSWEQRDAIEGAALHVRAISDTAGYYAGLAFGLVFASISEAVSR